MEMQVTWSHYSDDNASRHAAELLDDVVTAIRNRGYTRETALRLAAMELGVRIRRAKALLYGDPVALTDDELAAIRAAYMRHLDTEAAHLAARSAAARERLRRMQGGDP